MNRSIIKLPSITLVLVLILIVTISACGSPNSPATSTPKPTTPPTVAPTEKPTDIPPTIEPATVAPTEEIGGEATQSAQATLISFLAPAPGLEIGAQADINKLAADGKLSNGDAGQGEGKYTVLGCIGCHSLTRVAPPTEGTYTRVMDIRLKDAKNSAKTAEVYIAESIIRPNEYVVPEYATGIMPQDFGTRMTAPDLADLVAYLKAQK